MTDPTTPRSLLVEPVEQEIHPDRFAREVVREEPTEADRATVAIWGHCADFCAGTIYGETNGATIDDHGAFCESRIALWAQGSRSDGTPVEVCGSVVAPYQHGVYEKAAMPLRSDRLFAMRTVDLAEDEGLADHARWTFYGPGELRRMAAAFVRAADVIDGLEAPFARQDRRLG